MCGRGLFLDFFRVFRVFRGELSEGHVISATSVPPRRRGWGLWIIGVLVLLAAAAGGGVWWWLHRSVDWEAVYEANNRGVAVTDGFHYIEAIPIFEQVVRLAPDWMPGASTSASPC